MFRKLLLPIAAAAVLAGCVTSAPYGYRNADQGDYYYGAPSTDYRYHGGYPGYGYGSPYYGPYRPGISIYGTFGSRRYSPYHGGYGYPYGYGGGYPYGYPYGYYNGYPRGYPHSHPRPVHRPRPDGGTDNRPGGGAWRNIDDITRRRREVEGNPGAPAPSMPQFTRGDGVSEAPARARMSDEGSARGELVRRRRQGAEDE